jgi:hypothetical protein
MKRGPEWYKSATDAKEGAAKSLELVASVGQKVTDMVVHQGVLKSEIVAAVDEANLDGADAQDLKDALVEKLDEYGARYTTLSDSYSMMDESVQESFTIAKGALARGKNSSSNSQNVKVRYLNRCNVATDGGKGLSAFVQAVVPNGMADKVAYAVTRQNMVKGELCHVHAEWQELVLGLDTDARAAEEATFLVRSSTPVSYGQPQAKNANRQTVTTNKKAARPYSQWCWNTCRTGSARGYLTTLVKCSRRPVMTCWRSTRSTTPRRRTTMCGRTSSPVWSTRTLAVTTSSERSKEKVERAVCPHPTITMAIG